MFEARRGRAFQFGDDPLGERFAKLDTPLIEGIDIPDHALGEDVVFVEGDELSENGRRETLGEDRVGWPIAFENPMWNEPVGRAFCLHLLRSLAESQCLCLGEDVRHEHVVVASQRRQGLAEADKVARDESRSLVDQLVE